MAVLQLHRRARLIFYLPLTDSFLFHPSLLFAPLPSPRPGVPLGAKAICRGGGRASAQEQQADGRRHLSGGTLRGSVLLGTLGEYRKQRKRTKRSMFLFYFWPCSCQKNLNIGKRKIWPAERTRKRQQSVKTDKRRGAAGWRRIHCVGMFTLTVLSYPCQSFHHHLWTFLKVGIGLPTPMTSSLLSLYCWACW